MRIVHESQLHDENCFVTLTYDDAHLPRGGSLDVGHYQKFMKRLRKKFSDRKIRYYHCGEYGDQLERPHYHACLFGLRFPDQQLLKEGNGNFLFISETLQQLWPYGFSTVGELTFESAAYVARYCLKKITGFGAHDHYQKCDPRTGELVEVLPEYVTMSRRPGIGAEWYKKYSGDLWPRDEAPIPGRGVVKKVPRYYSDLLEKVDPVLFAEIKKRREKFRVENAEEYSAERLMAKYKVARAAVAQKRRSV